MPRGRRSRGLTLNQIARLETFRRAAHPEHGCPSGYSYPQLLAAMQPMPFKLDTLLRAIGGKCVWEGSHGAISQWIDRFLPGAASGPEIDGKAAASGEREEDAEQPERSDAEEAAGATRTVRGSR